MYSRENNPFSKEVSVSTPASELESDSIAMREDIFRKAARKKFVQTGERETVLYEDEKFDIYKKLSEVSGPLIEVAGPSDLGYELVDLKKIDKKIYVSNLFKGAPRFSVDTGEFIGYEGLVDFQADGTKLPLKPESVGAIFIKSLGDISSIEENRTKEQIQDDQQKLRSEAIREAAVALERGGILVFEGTDLGVLDYAQANGLKLKKQRVHYAEGNEYLGFDFIFEK